MSLTRAVARDARWLLVAWLTNRRLERLQPCRSLMLGFAGAALWTWHSPQWVAADSPA